MAEAEAEAETVAVRTDKRGNVRINIITEPEDKIYSLLSETRAPK